ncbi:malonate--CoA ligase [Pseudoroseicyclus tamaricis]|uniref:Malonyl-CoA synthase n=1 Tax=Pseudoroseicyclus tamaricis TaxID=2705421 RepID=A0A6B2K4B2_9RHOB|nr:malonyl-CoA synthase [Pseudoroseicyclus tamaricis]NDV02662.1 malonyl-CoA synthase [Pseudoroseicyclus tamaricis]
MENHAFDRLFGRHADAATPFLHLPDGSHITHQAFLHRAERFAHVLSGLGLQPGDRVAVQVPKCADALALYAATLQAGLVFLPLNTAYTAPEIGYFLADSGAALFVADPDRAELAEVAGEARAMFETLGPEATGTLPPLAALAPEHFETVARGPGDLAAILYTSGTTGRSKGAMLTGANLTSNAETLMEAWRFTADDVLLHALPIFHTHGLFVATNTTLVAGGSMILLPKFDVEEVLAGLPMATAMMGVPTFYTRLLAEERLTRDLVAHMRLFISGSAPLLAETHRAFTERTGHEILERYGMTELNMATSNPYEGERRPGTVGPPLPGVEAKVCNEAGEELPRGEIGMVEVRGPNVFAGYWGMPDKTAEEKRENGFFITGDLGQMSEDGYLTIVGRGKDLIISGGYNIYPREVEEMLDEAPGVTESAVIGIPHPDLGEVPFAVLAAPGEVETDALAASLEGRLARFKQPRGWAVVEALPRNTMGKVQKAELRARYKDSFQS